MVRLLPRPARLSFLLRFGGFSLLLFAVYCFPYAEVGISESLFNAYIDGYARLVGTILRVFEGGINVSLNRIHGRFSLEIAKGCDAMDCNILFVAAVLALPVRWVKKVVVLPAGLAAIAGGNVLRILALYYAGVYWPSRFRFLHTTLWPLLMLGFTVLLFLGVTAWMSENRQLSPAPAESR